MNGLGGIVLHHKKKKYIYIYGGAYIMVALVGNGQGNLSSNSGQSVCISHSTNILRKGMN